MNITVAPCSHEAAKYAVENWHYSQAMPVGKLVRYGIWEDDTFVGCVLYGRGANNVLGNPYKLDMTECVELVRIAMREHRSPVTQSVADTLKKLKASNPRLRLVVSFADPEQGHHGGIYQAGNWIYAGVSNTADEYIVNGVRTHGRSLRAKRASMGDPTREQNTLMWARKHLDPNTQQVAASRKHRYLYPLDKAMRRKIEKLRIQHPHAVEGSEVSRDTSGIEGQVRSLPTALNV